jgi:hypothetical protein
MSEKNNFQGFGGKLKSEALLKSVFGGVAIGGAVAFVAAAIFWFMEMNGILLCIAAFAAVTLISAVLLYLLVFKPTVVKNAKRLDACGLEERLITMVELEGNESLIAQKQREDAMVALGGLDTKRVKLKIPSMIISFFLVFFLLFAGMASVETLSEIDVLPSGSELWNKFFPSAPLRNFHIAYEANGGGYIIGDGSQMITEGEYSERVLAVADDGYIFYAWSDGDKDPTRRDKAVDRDIEVVALFVKVEEKEDDMMDEDEPDDVPGNSGLPGQSSGPSGGASGKYQEINMIMDGDTYYLDEAVWEEYYKRVKELAENGGQLPEDLLAIVKAYFDIIK